MFSARAEMSRPQRHGARRIVVFSAHDVDRGSLDALAHASTVATNAILEQKGAVTALLTTKGFRDVLEMRRLRIPVLYDLQYRKPAPLVARRLRLEIAERVGPGGAVWRPLDEAGVIAAVCPIPPGWPHQFITLQTAVPAVAARL